MDAKKRAVLIRLRHAKSNFTDFSDTRYTNDNTNKRITRIDALSSASYGYDAVSLLVYNSLVKNIPMTG